MTFEMKFEISSGNIFLEGTEIVLYRNMLKTDTEKSLQIFKTNHRDHKNGYEWISIEGLSLAGYSACMSLCFYQNMLIRVEWGIVVPNLKLKDGWPTEESIHKEIKILRSILAKKFGRSFSSGEEHFKWGVVWASFDLKAYQASSGLYYKV